MSLGEKRDIVLRGLRVRVERSWMRVPDVTAKRSVEGLSVVKEDGSWELERPYGCDMWVMGAFCGDGRSLGDLKVRQ